MDFYFYVTVIIGFSLIYYGYIKKIEIDLKMKELEIKEKQIELETKILEKESELKKEM